MQTNEGHARSEERCFPDSDTPRQVMSTPAQVLAGLPIGLATLEAICSCCGRGLGEGAEVEVYAYRAAEAPRWTVARCYCTECGPGMITTPTLGVTEALVAVQLAVVSRPAERRHSLCLSSPTLLSFSPPDRGSVP